MARERRLKLLVTRAQLADLRTAAVIIRELDGGRTLAALDELEKEARQRDQKDLLTQGVDAELRRLRRSGLSKREARALRKKVLSDLRARFAKAPGPAPLPVPPAAPSKCTCCDRAEEYNGFRKGLPHLFDCPKNCACHD